MGLFDFLEQQRKQQQRKQQQHRDTVSPWERYAREDDKEQRHYCSHDHDSYGCDE